MLAEARDHIVIPSVTSKILRLLDSLKRSEGGASIYNYIETVIRETEATCHQVEHAYANVLTLLLDTLAQQLPDGSSLQVQLKLLELRLLPPLAPADLKNLQDFLNLHGDDFSESVEDAGDVVTKRMRITNESSGTVDLTYSIASQIHECDGEESAPLGVIPYPFIKPVAKLVFLKSICREISPNPKEMPV